MNQDQIREQFMPEPFGYVSDGFHDGLHFKHKPWPEMHMLVHSVAAVYSASQLLQAIDDAKAAGRSAALDEAADIVDNADTPDCGGWTASGIADAIRALKGTT